MQSSSIFDQRMAPVPKKNTTPGYGTQSKKIQNFTQKTNLNSKTNSETVKKCKKSVLRWRFNSKKHKQKIPTKWDGRDCKKKLGYMGGVEQRDMWMIKMQK